MVADMQTMLLTGGVKVNIFRDKRDGDVITCILNDKEQLKEAKAFFLQQKEVSSIYDYEDSNPGGHVFYNEL